MVVDLPIHLTVAAGGAAEAERPGRTVSMSLAPFSADSVVTLSGAATYVACAPQEK